MHFLKIKNELDREQEIGSSHNIVTLSVLHNLPEM